MAGLLFLALPFIPSHQAPVFSTPGNEGVGPCHGAILELQQRPTVRHIYTTTETLTVAIRYKATGCKNMIVTFGGRHHIGSPWYTHWCDDVIHKQLNAPNYDCGNWVPSTIGRRASLTSDDGTVVFQLGPGHNEGLLPGDPDITIDGFQLCGLAVVMNDGIPGGSRQTSDVGLGCDSNSKSG